MKKITVVLIILLFTACGCSKKNTNNYSAFKEIGSGDGSHDTTNTVLYQNRDLSY